MFVAAVFFTPSPLLRLPPLSLRVQAGVVSLISREVNESGESMIKATSPPLLLMMITNIAVNSRCRAQGLCPAIGCDHEIAVVGAVSATPRAGPRIDWH